MKDVVQQRNFVHPDAVPAEPLLNDIGTSAGFAFLVTHMCPYLGKERGRTAGCQAGQKKEGHGPRSRW